MPGLYFHIPFCVQKCLYCDFTSFSCTEEQDRYTKALLEEIKLKKQLLRQQEWSTVFFGGGTPSLLSVENLERILRELDTHISFENVKEFTVEVNPKTLSKDKLIAYTKIGVNRLSVGVQSFNEEELKAIGRIHGSQDAVSTIKIAQNAGFSNISLDLIYGLPHQTKESLSENIKIAASLGVTHISLYGLQLEENTPLANLVKDNEVCIPLEEELADMYLGSVSLLNELGYEQYEVSNFAKNEHFCLHNLVYWNYDDYLGFGLSSHSKSESIRYANTDSLTAYINKLVAKQIPIVFEESLEIDDMDFEKSMLALRTKWGVPVNEIKDQIALNSIISSNFGKIEDNRFKLTPKGFLVSNDIINKLL